MSTFNGERFLREQLNSIFSQKDVHVEVFVRDDLSSDKTLDIIKEYKNNNFRIHLIESNDNLGPGLSFMRLLYEVSRFEDRYDYYAFADQDDIWMDTKLSNAILCIKKVEKKRVLYSSNQTLYINGEPRGNRYQHILAPTLKGYISKNYISGCTFVFDKALFEIFTSVSFPNEKLIKARCHDSWLLLEALLCGTVLYDENSYILYRIHGNNAVGIKKLTIKERIKRVIFNSKEMKNLRSITAKELLLRFPNADSKYIETLKEFADYSTSRYYRKMLITDKEITNFTKENRFIFMIKVLIGYV